MDSWLRTLDQLRALVRGLSAAQRVSLSAVGVALMAGLGWLVYSTTSPSEEFLLGGKTFSASELAQTQSVLKQAGLTQFKVTGQRISVPAREADRYTAAALAQQTLPAQFAAEFDRMQSKVNLFTSGEQRRELLEEARKARLSQILRSIPEIEEAVVEWDRPRQVNLFRPAPQLAAHVSVKPRDGRELSPELVQSLKLFVAGALAGAQPDDVTVVDMNTTRVYGRRSPEDVAADRFTDLTRQTEARYTAQITRALSYIPDLLVTVKVDTLVEREEQPAIDPPVNSNIVPVSRRSTTRSNAWRPRSNHPPLHEIDSAPTFERTARNSVADTTDDHHSELDNSVQVSVSIPEHYYAALARQQGISPGESYESDSAYRGTLASLKAETQRGVREKLARLLPHDIEASSISVTTHAALDPAASKPDTAQATAAFPFAEILEDWQTRTGIAVCGSCLLFVFLRWRFPRETRNPQLPEQSIDNSPADLDSEYETHTDYPEVGTHPHALVMTELAELERRSTSAAAPQRPNLFGFLHELSVDDAARLLQHEHPQTIALVATALAPTEAARILYCLPESLRWDVTQRLARIGPAAPDVLNEVASSLKSRLSANATIETNSAPAASQFEQLSPPAIPALQPPANWADQPEAQNGPLTFDDLAAFDIRALTTLLESVDVRACAVALLDRSNAFRQAFLSKVSKQVAAAIKQQSQQLGPVRLNEITAAQQAIASAAWNLAVNGVLVLPSELQHAS